MQRVCLTALATLMTISATSAAAGETDAVSAAADALMAAWNANSPDVLRHFHPDASGYGGDGGVLGTIDAAAVEELVAAGYDVSLRLNQQHVRVLGDVAVSVGYMSGTISVPGAPTQQGTWRTTAVWTRLEDAWKLLHWHHSPLVSEVRSVERGPARRDDRERMDGPRERRRPDRDMGRQDGERDRPGAAMLVRHSVENFDHWTEVYREHERTRAEYGSLGSHVYRSADDANDIVVAVQWRGLEGALAFGASDALHAAMAEAGVVGEPQAWVFDTEHVRPVVDREGANIGGPSDFSLFVRHKVENLERWMGAFNEHGHMRAEAGSLGGFVLFHPHEQDDVIGFLGWESIDAAREFVGSPDLKAAMEASGVIDEPDILFLTHAYSTER